MADDGAPLTPDGKTAHGWLQHELAKPVYADQRTLLQRLWDWATSHLQDLLNGVGSALPTYVLVPLLVLIIALVVFGLTRLRGNFAGGRGAATEGVLAGVELSAEQLRQRAARAEVEGKHAAAYLDFFRAVARRAEERALLLPQPGRTAHEVGIELAPFFPGSVGELASAATHFDAIRYGAADANASDVDRIRALDQGIEHARPQHLAQAAG
ncbi:DUF4129 domain-containing protein [Flexivirga caeni]|uniref:DUF4129 domain-containing protein n=1 Tax=Flexivirga caeni TaxID=2294115 RepID=A0A3M9M9A5_9MICO|nr:DUF4129 domain-containing protein [Flexivirga caeni]RNI22160.1 DUF4129 domain-containing protein [Flexivirga caeni]